MIDVIQHGERAGAQQAGRRDPMYAGGPDAWLREALEAGIARGSQDSWQPTLAGSDLACLLKVIEAELLPRLLGAYRPAGQAPLKATHPG